MTTEIKVPIAPNTLVKMFDEHADICNIKFFKLADYPNSTKLRNQRNQKFIPGSVDQYQN